MEPVEAIQANAEFVAEQLGPTSNVPMDYGEASIRLLDGFIERQRVRPEVDDEAREGLVNTLGSYVGEALRRNFGGEWVELPEGWGIRFTPKFIAYPFNKVRKQFESGAADSVHAFYRSIAAVLRTRA